MKREWLKLYIEEISIIDTASGSGSDVTEKQQYIDIGSAKPGDLQYQWWPQFVETADFVVPSDFHYPLDS